MDFLVLRLSVYKVSRHLFCRIQHVLISTNNSAKAVYINNQEGVCSAKLLSLARRLLCWVLTHTLSIQALHIPSEIKKGADVMLKGDCCLHPDLASQIWVRIGRAKVDMFATRGNALCPL